MHQRQQRAIIFMPTPASPSATFVPATAVLIPQRVQEVVWRAAKALHRNKIKKKKVLSVTTHQKHKECNG